MIEFAHRVSVGFLPSLAAGVALAVAWRYVEIGRLRTTLQTIAALLFFVPQPFALFLGGYSARLRFYQQALLSAWGLGSAALMFARLRPAPAATQQSPGHALAHAIRWRQSPGEIRRTEYAIAATRNRREGSSSQNKLVLALAAIVLTALGACSGWATIGDYLLAPQAVTGTVEGARVIHNRRSPNAYEVMIDHRPYNITLDLLSRMSRGDYVEADVGVATKTIVAIRRDAHAIPGGSSR